MHIYNIIIYNIILMLYMCMRLLYFLYMHAPSVYFMYALYCVIYVHAPSVYFIYACAFCIFYVYMRLLYILYMHAPSVYFICACALCIFYICVVLCVFASPFSFPVLTSVLLSLSVSLPDRDKTHGLTSSTRMIQTYQKRLALYMRLRIKTLAINMSNWRNARRLSIVTI